jgi:chromosome segregation ATPase
MDQERMQLVTPDPIQQALGTVRDTLRFTGGLSDAGPALALIEQRLGELGLQLAQSEKIVLKRGQEIDRQMRRAERAEQRLEELTDAEEMEREIAQAHEVELKYARKRIEALEQVAEAARRFEQAYRQDREWDQEADELDETLAALARERLAEAEERRCAERVALDAFADWQRGRASFEECLRAALAREEEA